MEKSVRDNLMQHIRNMRKKVIEAKGEAVQGLSDILIKEDKGISKPVKTRETNA